MSKGLSCKDFAKSFFNSQSILQSHISILVKNCPYFFWTSLRVYETLQQTVFDTALSNVISELPSVLNVVEMGV